MLVMPKLKTARYMYKPGTMMTIAGTVIAIRGKPTLSRTKLAISPANNAPMNAAKAAGTWLNSTKLSRKVFAKAPMTAATVAIDTLALNMIEKPKTPQKLAIILQTVNNVGLRFNLGMAPGDKLSIVAMPQPTIAAIITTNIA